MKNLIRSRARPNKRIKILKKTMSIPIFETVGTDFALRVDQWQLKLICEVRAMV